jgi:hypothetical protein
MENEFLWNLITSKFDNALSNLHQFHSREHALIVGQLALVETLVVLNATNRHINQAMQAYRFVANGMDPELAKKATGFDLDIHYNESAA